MKKDWCCKAKVISFCCQMCFMNRQNHRRVTHHLSVKIFTCASQQVTDPLIYSLPFCDSCLIIPSRLCSERTKSNNSDDLWDKTEVFVSSVFYLCNLVLNSISAAFQWRFMNTRWCSRPSCWHQLSLLAWLLTHSSRNGTSASLELGSSLFTPRICPIMYQSDVSTGLWVCCCVH